MCDNCEAESEVAFTLTAHVPGEDRDVTTEFCSVDCLQEWT